MTYILRKRVLPESRNAFILITKCAGGIFFFFKIGGDLAARMEKTCEIGRLRNSSNESDCADD